MTTTFPLGLCILTGALDPIFPLPEPAQALLDSGAVEAFCFPFEVYGSDAVVGNDSTMVYYRDRHDDRIILSGWKDCAQSDIPNLPLAVLSLTQPHALHHLPLMQLWSSVVSDRVLGLGRYNLSVFVMRDHAWVGFWDIDTDCSDMSAAMDEALHHTDPTQREHALATLQRARGFEAATIGTLIFHTNTVTTAHQQLALPARVQAASAAYLRLLFGDVHKPTEPSHTSHLTWPLTAPDTATVRAQWAAPTEV